MQTSPPDQWSPDAEWHPDVAHAADEIPHLAALATQLLERDDTCSVVLDDDEPDACVVVVSFANVKTAEVYVNIETAGGARRVVFSVYAGATHDEYHGASTESVIDHVLSHRSAWHSDDG